MVFSSGLRNVPLLSNTQYVLYEHKVFFTLLGRTDRLHSHLLWTALSTEHDCADVPLRHWFHPPPKDPKVEPGVTRKFFLWCSEGPCHCCPGGWAGSESQCLGRPLLSTRSDSCPPPFAVRASARPCLLWLRCTFPLWLGVGSPLMSQGPLTHVLCSFKNQVVCSLLFPLPLLLSWDPFICYM